MKISKNKNLNTKIFATLGVAGVAISLYVNAVSTPIKTITNLINQSPGIRTLINFVPSSQLVLDGKQTAGYEHTNPDGSQSIFEDENTAEGKALETILHEYTHATSRLQDDEFNFSVADVQIGDTTYDGYFTASEVSAYLAGMTVFNSHIADYTGQLATPQTQSILSYFAGGGPLTDTYDAAKTAATDFTSMLGQPGVASSLVSTGSATALLTYSGQTTTQTISLVMRDNYSSPTLQVTHPTDEIFPKGTEAIVLDSARGNDLSTANLRQQAVNIAITKLPAFLSTMESQAKQDYIAALMTKNHAALAAATAKDIPVKLPPLPKVMKSGTMQNRLASAVAQQNLYSGYSASDPTPLQSATITISTNTSHVADGSVTVGAPVQYLLIKWPDGSFLSMNLTTGAITTLGPTNPSQDLQSDITDGTAQNIITSDPAQTTDGNNSTSAGGAVSTPDGVESSSEPTTTTVTATTTTPSDDLVYNSGTLKMNANGWGVENTRPPVRILHE